jgi:FkbM family methyltransferase
MATGPVKRLAKQAVKRSFRAMGLEIRRWRPETDQPTLEGTLRRLLEHRIDFETVIDVGASNGCWSLELQRHFPGKSHLLVEANPIHEASLIAVCNANPTWHYVLKAAGGKEGSLYFDDSDPQGGHLSEKPLSANYKPFPVTTLDSEVSRLGLRPPFLIKLDVHGVEVPILEGASNTLKLCEILVIECYNFPSVAPCLSFWEMCTWMSSKGFLPLDIHDILYREYDHSFWQLDLLFARETRPEFAYRSYR